MAIQRSNGDDGSIKDAVGELLKHIPRLRAPNAAVDEDDVIFPVLEQS